MLIEPLVNLQSTLSLALGWSGRKARDQGTSLLFYLVFFFFSPLPHLFSLHELLFPIHKHIAVELYGHAWNMINKISSPNTSLFNCSLKQSTHSHFSVPCFLYFLHLHLLPSPFLHIQNAFGRFSFSLPYLFRDNMGRRRTTRRKMNRRILHL